METSSHSQSSYQLITDNSCPEATSTKFRAKGVGSYMSKAFAFMLIEIANAILLLLWLRWNGCSPFSLAIDPKSYQSLNQYEQVAIFEETGYESRVTNSSYWASLFPESEGIISVAVSDPISLEQPSKKSPFDPSHMIYQVSLFHHLHCLELLKFQLVEMGQVPGHTNHVANSQHTVHCIDRIRQALMCNADLTLDTTSDFRAFGQGSRHKCRDFRKIFKWTEENRYRGSLEALRTYNRSD